MTVPLKILATVPQKTSSDGTSLSGRVMRAVKEYLNLPVHESWDDSAELISEYLERLCRDLGLPVSPQFELSFDDEFERIEIENRQIPTRAVEGDHLSSGAQRIAETIFRCRELLITDTVVDAVREEWPHVNVDAKAGSPKLLRNLLKAAIACGASVDRISDLVHDPEEIGVGDHSIEPLLDYLQTESDLPGAQLILSTQQWSENERRIDDLQIQELLHARLLSESGVYCAVQPELKASLGNNDFIFALNDIQSPVMKTFGEASRLVDAAIEQVEPAGIKGIATKHPLTGNSATIIGRADSEVLEEHGIPTWDPRDYIYFKIRSLLNQNISAFWCASAFDSNLSLLVDMAPQLVQAVRDQYDEHRIVGVLRALINEQIPITNLYSLLNDLLAVRGGVLTQDKEPRPTTFEPAIYAPVLEPTLEDGQAPGDEIIDRGDVPISSLAEHLRVVNKDAFFRGHADSLGVIKVIAVDQTTEQRLIDQHENRFDSAQQDQLLRSVIRTLESIERDYFNVPILVSSNARLPMCELIKFALPERAVLSVEEIPVNAVVQKIATIGID